MAPSIGSSRDRVTVTNSADIIGQDDSPRQGWCFRSKSSKITYESSKQAILGRDSALKQQPWNMHKRSWKRQGISEASDLKFYPSLSPRGIFKEGTHLSESRDTRFSSGL